MNTQKFYHNEFIVFSILFFVTFAFLLYAISNLSISYYEADIFYNKNNLISFIVNISCQIFGQNDYSLRIPFIFLHFINCILLYKLSKFILKRRFDRVLSVMLYMGLPGVLTSAIMINSASIIIFFTLLILYFEATNRKFMLFLAILLSFFADKSFYILYFCIFLYAFYYKKKELSILSLSFFILSIIFYEIGTQGKPKNFFLDTFGVFAATFSPIVFILFIYAIYRIWVKDSKNLLWFVVSGTFILSILFSLRQKLELDSVLPYCVIATPLILRTVLNSYRIRLPKFRKFHKFVILITTLFLVFSSLTIVFNNILYANIFKNSPHKHFIYKFDIAKELSNKLKKNGINAIKCSDEKLQLRLKFYGIENGEKLLITQDKNENFDKSIEIYKFGILVDKFFIYNIF